MATQQTSPASFCHRPRYSPSGWAAQSHRCGAVHLRLSLSGNALRRPVTATIANGKLTRLDTAAAEKMPGVRAILHRGNIGKIFRSFGPGVLGICEERRPPFEDDVVRYYGQYIALAVAETF